MVVWIAIGSALGGVSRYLFGGLIQRLFDTPFPSGTLAINVVGSLLLGFIIRYSLETPAVSPELRGFLTIGFCGGFTTFSTFSYESAVMLEEGQWTRLAAYVGLSVLLTVAGTLAGFAVAREVLTLRRSA
ncbi:MAG TPA: fluoride efflux transporter CrcB [Gemmatimonadales bacterium]|jgi:fluoride exporter|nr:fluoride efflux transporter CrcB [Gemmatimonadales bacterium]